MVRNLYSRFKLKQNRCMQQQLELKFLQTIVLCMLNLPLSSAAQDIRESKLHSQSAVSK